MASEMIDLPDYPKLSLTRNAQGVIQVQASNEADLYRGLGYAHALDRASQLSLMRILGRGEGCLHLEDSEAMLAIDSFFRRLNWRAHIEREISALSDRARWLCEAYCDGINLYLARKRPALLRLLGYVPEPWSLADIILLSRMTGYLTLAQSQAELERFVVQMAQAGVSQAHLEALFPEQLQGLDLPLLQKVRMVERVIPEAVQWHPLLAPMMASNNWVVAPQRSASGQALLANDPHLEGNRLPNVWYEVGLRLGERYALGASMPGLPGLLLGRTPDLAWGATYAFMDSVDSWIEDCREGQYRRGAEWQPFVVREELIRRKNHPDLTLCFYENEHGVLEGDPHEPGYYLSTCWSASRSGARSLESMLQLWAAADVPQGMQVLGQLETSWNWVLADSQGNIGYQMSGRLPRRAAGVSGLVPLPGWDPANDWQGFEPPERLPRCLNPEQGYFVTANQDLNAWGLAQPCNAPMGPYRAQRIAERLQAQDKLSLADLQAIQQDLYSPQAALFMARIRPLLPQTPEAELLRDWDGCYQPESPAPVLFERIYQGLFQQVFGQVLGADVSTFMTEKTGLLADFYHHFDRVLLAEDSVWFQGQSWQALYGKVIGLALATPAQNWKQHNHFMLRHILLGGKTPAWTGIDKGPLPLKGGRATPHQGQIYQSGERQTSFMPTYRFVTDFAEAGLHSCLLGGPSDWPGSRWYASEVQAWLAGTYKYLGPEAG